MLAVTESGYMKLALSGICEERNNKTYEMWNKLTHRIQELNQFHNDQYRKYPTDTAKKRHKMLIPSDYYSTGFM